MLRSSTPRRGTFVRCCARTGSGNATSALPIALIAPMHVTNSPFRPNQILFEISSSFHNSGRTDNCSKASAVAADWRQVQEEGRAMRECAAREAADREAKVA